MTATNTGLCVCGHDETDHGRTGCWRNAGGTVECACTGFRAALNPPPPRPADREQEEASGRLERWAVVSARNVIHGQGAGDRNAPELTTLLERCEYWHPNSAPFRIARLVELRPNERIVAGSGDLGNNEAPINGSPAAVPPSAALKAPPPDTEQELEQLRAEAAVLLGAVINEQPESELIATVVFDHAKQEVRYERIHGTDAVVIERPEWDRRVRAVLSALAASNTTPAGGVER